MDNRTDEKSTQELLRRMAAVQRRDHKLSVISTIAVLILAAALILSLALVVPKLMDALDTARVTLSETQQVIGRVSTSLDELDSVGQKLGGLTGEGAENLAKLIETLNTVDVNAFTEAIQSFNGLLSGLQNFRLFG